MNENPAAADPALTPPMPDPRKERELDFHNKRFATGTRGEESHSDPEGVEKFYAIAASSQKFYADRLLEYCKGGRILEYGCGTGSLAFRLACGGAREVVGIDISDVAIEKARGEAHSRGVSHVSFEVMDAERLTFEDNSFDLICGSAILHHLDLKRCFEQIGRTLKPGGRAVFLEPLGHNPAINLYRWLTPKIRTPDEHPLLMRDFRLARSYFGQVDLTHFHLLSLATVPLRRWRIFPRLLRWADSLDAAVFTVLPFAKRYSWSCVVVLSKPVGKGEGA
jgi:SAM-dependent methyltransferase